MPYGGASERDSSNLYPPTFSKRKGVRFSSGFVESLCSYPEMPENLPKIYEDNPNVSKDVPKIFGSRSQDIPCQAHPLLIQD